MNVEIKTVQILAKVDDRFTAVFLNSEGVKIKYYNGYVPFFMPGNHRGDYIDLNIDIETGKILNWKKIDKAQLDDFFNN